MTHRKNQAVKTRELHANREARVRFLFRVTYVILALSLVLWGWSLIGNSNFFPIKQVIIRGQYNNTNPAEIKTILQPYLNKGLLQVKTRILQRQLQELPWVKTAEIKRDWPSTLVIVLTQKVPIARWFKNGLITSDADVFFPPTSTIPANLPMLSTTSNLISEGIVLLSQIKLSLTSINLRVNTLILTQRQTISITLQSSTPGATSAPTTITVLLGRNNVQERLDRFIDVYPKVFANRLDKVEYADMRYTNGMAVKWKQTPVNKDSK